MKNFEARFNSLNKAEIHIHLEGAIRTQTILDVASENDLCGAGLHKKLFLDGLPNQKMRSIMTLN
jgi:adenosine deaminase